MAYQNDGTGRDAYINTKIKDPAVITTLRSKKGEVPANVYRRLVAEANKEQYEVYSYQNAKQRNRILMEGGGKLKVTPDHAELQEEERMRVYEHKMWRKEKMLDLYKNEFSDWQQTLAKRGLTIEVDRD
eukprot:PhM_4_TR10934/c0_g1_i1/m.40366